MGKKSNSDTKWLVKQVAIASIVALLTVIIILTIFGLITRHGKEIEVPNLISLNMKEAKKVAKQSHIKIKISDSTYIPKMQKGIIYRQTPAAGSLVKKGRRVMVIINSTTPKLSKVPNVVGQSLREAQGNLNSAKFRVGKLIYTPDIATNNVLRQLINGASVPPGKEIPMETEIDLEVGLGSKGGMTRIPNLKGTSYYDVKNQLVYYCLNLNKMIFDGSVKTYSDSVNSFVFKQDPPPTKTNGYRLGTGVTVYLTTNKQLISE